MTVHRIFTNSTQHFSCVVMGGAVESYFYGTVLLDAGVHSHIWLPLHELHTGIDKKNPNVPWKS